MSHDPVERAWREERAGVVATLARRLGDLELAEDAVQEAFAAAAVRWPADGVPDRPGAWLTTTAWRRALDVLRRERPTVELEQVALGTDDPVLDGALAVADDRLALVLTCCHPSLALDARVALTLRHVAGLTAREIAAAFLVEEAAMAKRLVRARVKIRDARIRFEVPARDELPARLAAVHAVLYLVFTEGHLASGDGAAVRSELCDEAIWLARQLDALAPDDAETAGLLALMLLQHARTAARQDAGGQLVPFDRQDRGLWDATAIAEARELLAATRTGPLGSYQVQAAIAMLHAATPEGGRPDWRAIAALYELLGRLAPSPVVELNRAVAVARAQDARAGLAILAGVLDDPRLAHYAPLHAAHADLLERAGEPAAAAAAWSRALRLAQNPSQKRELQRRRDVLSPFRDPSQG